MTGHQITAPDQALQFITAGRAVVTLQSDKTGNHFTFKVKKTTKAGAASHFIHVRTAGAEGNYAYLGYLRGGRQFVHGIGKSKIDVSDPCARAFRYVLTQLLLKNFPAQCQILHEGRCGRCGRALTHPDSIKSGIGPECATKMECF